MPVTKSKRPYSYTDHKARRKKSFFFLRIFLLLFALHSLVTWLVVAPVSAGSRAMQPAVNEGDFFLHFPLAYGPVNPFSPNPLPGLSKPASGDLVVVDPSWVSRPDILRGTLDALVRFATLQRYSPFDEGKARWERGPQLKRVIALPGDTLYMKDFVFYVRRAGTAHFLTEFEVSAVTYEVFRERLPDGFRPAMPFSGTMAEITLGEREYFVAGDNRTASLDSRHWGAVDRGAIRGKVALRYWPFTRFGLP